MTAKEEPSRFNTQLPPEMRELVEKAFEAMDEKSDAGSTYQETFSYHINQPPTRPDYWTRWAYDTDEWELLDRIDWGRARQKFLVSISVTALLYIVIAGFFELSLVSLQLSFSVILLPALFIPLILLIPATLLLYSFAWLQFRDARKRHLARRNGPRRVTIGSPHLFDQDMWLAGLHIPLQKLFIELVRVSLSSRPPLVLSLRRRHSIRSGTGSWRDLIHLLVPRGHEEEAKQLVERFRTETIGASKRRRVPVEPEPNVDSPSIKSRKY